MNTCTGTTLTLGVTFDFECDYDEDGPQELRIRPKGTEDWIDCDLTEVGGAQWDMLEAAIVNNNACAGDRQYDEWKESEYGIA